MTNKIKFWAAFPFLVILSGIFKVIEWWHFGPSQSVLKWKRKVEKKVRDWVDRVYGEDDPLDDLA